MKKIIVLASAICLFIFTNTYAQVSQDDNSEFSAQKVTSIMKAGKTYSVSITFKNTGKSIWEKDKYWIIYTDPRMNARNNNEWGIDSIKVSKNVKPGSKHQFKFKVTAPSEPGTYFFAWTMCSEKGSFGFGSDLQQITVEK